MLEAPVKRKKPELIAVNVIPWSAVRGLYGIETVFDDGIVVREAWGSRLDTTVAAAIRRKDIRVLSPRRPSL
jgi:hypothetical protein